jgi:ParB family chromosome partitioning protein
MPKATPRLGKGLSALVGPRPASPFKHRPPSPTTVAGHPSASPRTEATIIHELPLDRIRPNPNQPRLNVERTALDQLANSIRQTGILQPVLVRSVGHEEFELIAGERRWRAAQIAELPTIPAIIRELNQTESFELALIENLQREDLAPLERATAYQQLIDSAGLSVEALATRLGESRANIANYLRLLRLDREVQDMLNAGELAMGQARAIAGVSNPQQQLALARLAVRRNLSVRQVERLAREPSEPQQPASRPPRPMDGHLSDVEQAMTKALGLHVTLHPGKRKNSGRVVIRYSSLEEFDRIAEKIGGRALME